MYGAVPSPLVNVRMSCEPAGREASARLGMLSTSLSLESSAVRTAVGLFKQGYSVSHAYSCDDSLRLV